MNYLFVFTIGPVSTLINNSRKINDMYAGSKLLSGLMEQIINHLKDSYHEDGEAEVLFPNFNKEACKEKSDNSAEDKKQKKSDIPNRLIARIAVASEEKIEKIGKSLEQYAKNQFMKDCIKTLSNQEIDEKGIELAKQQLERFLEVYWIAEPVDDFNDEKEYKAAYQNVFRKLQAIKGIRPFQQINEQWNRKCMLFPEYNAIFVRKKEDGSYPANVNKSNIYENDILDNYLKPGEAVSAIALVKRLYKDAQDINSLRYMLLENELNLLEIEEQENDELKNKKDDLANAVYDIDHDNLDKNKYDDDDIKDRYIKKVAEDFYNNIKAKGGTLSSYYALIKLDGDSMGEKFLECDLKGQRELSGRISCFAQAVPRIWKEHKGISVYAGGEDVLGFVPLTQLFLCLNDLYTAFQDHVNGYTFSAGIVVAHLMQPLKEVAADAEKMEHLAKQAEGKNSCVFSINKRSGDTVVTDPISFNPKSIESPKISLEKLKDLINDLEEGNYSKSLLYHISDLFQQFLKEKEAPEEVVAEVLIRQCAKLSGIPDLNAIVKDLMVFYCKEHLQNFLSILDVAVFLAREEAN